MVWQKVFQRRFLNTFQNGGEKALKQINGDMDQEPASIMADVVRQQMLQLMGDFREPLKTRINPADLM